VEVESGVLRWLGLEGGIGVVGSIVFGIGVGIVVRENVSRIKPTRMLAFSASRLMRCGGGVMGIGGGVGGVALVGAVGGVIGIGGGIVVDIGVIVIVVREAVSRIKPARMLAFSASKSMRCGDTVLGRGGGGVVGSEGWNVVVRLFGIASQLMVVCLLDAWFVFVFFLFFIVFE